VATGKNVWAMLCVASGPRIQYWVGYRGVISPTIILTPTIHPDGVKGAFGAALMLPIIHPDGVGKNIRGGIDAINFGNLY